MSKKCPCGSPQLACLATSPTALAVPSGGNASFPVYGWCFLLPHQEAEMLWAPAQHSSETSFPFIHVKYLTEQSTSPTRHAHPCGLLTVINHRIQNLQMLFEDVWRSVMKISVLSGLCSWMWMRCAVFRHQRTTWCPALVQVWLRLDT